MAIFAVILLNPILFGVSIASRNQSIFSLLTPLIALGTLLCAFARRAALRMDFLDFAILAFLIFFFVRNIDGPENAAVIKFVTYGGCLYYLAAIVVQNRKTFNILIIAIVLISATAIIYGFIEYAVQYNFLFPNHSNLQPSNTIHRIGSTLSQPVLFGAFLVQAFPYIFLLSFSNQLWWRSLAITTFIWAFAALLLTYSKGSWIAVALISAASFIYLVRSGIKKIGPIFGVVIICLAIVAAFWNQAYNDISVRMTSSIGDRLVTWDGASKGISDNLFMGVGFRRGGDIMNTYLESGWNKNLIDNTYLSIFMEQGLLGFSLWMIILGTTIVYGIRASRIKSGTQLWALAALASVTGFLINSFTFDAYLVWANIALFWISVGIIRGIYQPDSNIDKTEDIQKQLT
ncbi:MAG: O-antigen ligase family protein [Thermoleophilia bacterium]